MPEPSRFHAMQNWSVSVPDNVVFRELSNETVLLNIRPGQYHGIDPIGTRFFEVLRSASHVAAACEELARAFEQPVAVIRTDVAAFVDDLVSRGLVTLDEHHRATG